MSAQGTNNRPTLTSRDEFRFLTDLVLRHSTSDHTFVALHDGHGGTTRFANNQIIQNVNTRRVTLAVTAAFGQQHGTASTTDLSAGAVQEALQRAEQIARVSPEDPEYLPPAPPQQYVALPTLREETATTGPDRRLTLARDAIELCKAENLQSAGIVSSSLATVGVSASTGLFAYDERTDSRFSVTATGEETTGWASNVHRSIEGLEVRERTRVAIEKATRFSGPVEMSPGRYTVILEPAAVAGLLAWIIWMLDAKSYYKGTSPYIGKLDQRIVDERLTLRNHPEHWDLVGSPFTGEGLPGNDFAWIEKGVLRQLAYDRFTARQHSVDPLPTLDAPHLSAEGAAAPSTEALIRTTERGILVTNFWYLRIVNPTDLTLTGMTRDGTFLIADGEIATGVCNFRFHESPLRALNQLEAFTAPMEASSAETGKLLVPAMKLLDFNFSSVTRF